MRSVPSLQTQSLNALLTQRQGRTGYVKRYRKYLYCHGVDSSLFGCNGFNFISLRDSMTIPKPCSHGWTEDKCRLCRIEREKLSCKKCHGTGVEEYKNHPNGQVENIKCSECNGFGTEQCYACKGTGLVIEGSWDAPYREDCPVCTPSQPEPPKDYSFLNKSDFYKPSYEELQKDNRRLLGEMISKDEAFAMYKSSENDVKMKFENRRLESVIGTLRKKIERLQNKIKKLKEPL